MYSTKVNSTISTLYIFKQRGFVFAFRTVQAIWANWTHRLSDMFTILKKMTFLSIPLLLIGCQSLSNFNSSNTPPSHSVMQLWNSYTQCQSNTDMNQAHAEALELNQAAAKANLLSPSPVPLPTVITKQVSEPISRLSVDPGALSASCSLHAGQLALNQGEKELAAEMFELVLEHQERGEYQFYRKKAKEGLLQTQRSKLISSTDQTLPFMFD